MYTEIEKRAVKFLDETDIAQFSTMELLTMFADKELTLQLQQTGVSGSLLLTIDNVSNMLSYCSKATWIQLQGDDKGWKEWWKKRDELNVNSNDR